MAIDHRDGGGGKERKALGGPSKWYREVIAHPERYQLLCFNCNHIKRIEEREHGSGRPRAEFTPEEEARFAQVWRNRMAGKRSTRKTGWTLRYAACISCGETSRKHQGGGKCTRCYMRDRHVAKAGRTA